jgi:hypothetical protein
MTMTASDEELSAGLYIQKQMLPEWRIKQAKLVGDGARVIKPAAHRRDSCREEVEKVTLALAASGALLGAKDQGNTKQGKLAAGKVARALRVARIALKDARLDLALKAYLTMNISPEKLQALEHHCEKQARFRSGSLPRKVAERKSAAITAAVALMKQYCKGEADNAAKGSPLCKLASLLYGQPSADLSNQCKTALREARKKAGQE